MKCVVPIVRGSDLRVLHKVFFFPLLLADGHQGGKLSAIMISTEAFTKQKL